MTRDELVQSIIAYAGDDYDPEDSKQVAFLAATVDDAIEEVCNEMNPYSVSNCDELESIKKMALKRYGHVIRRVAMFHYDKQGKEGVTTFYESGQTTSFESGGTPSQFFDGIVTMARIV